MGANKPATTTTTQTRNPWSQTAGQMTDITNKVDNLSKNTDLWAPNVSGATQHGMDQYAALGQQDQTQGHGLLSDVTGGSQQGFQAGLGQLQNTAAGAYVNGNPYFDAAMKPGLDDVTNRVNGQFTAAGRYGSGNHAAELTRQLGNVEAQARQQNYMSERSQQQQAANTLYGGGYQGANLAGQLDQSSTLPAEYNLKSGIMQDTLANQTKQAPINAVNWQNGIISPMSSQYGTTTGTSQTVQPVNKTNQWIGAGMMGLGVLGAPFTGGASLSLAGTGAKMYGGGG